MSASGRSVPGTAFTGGSHSRSARIAPSPSRRRRRHGPWDAGTDPSSPARRRALSSRARPGEVASARPLLREGRRALDTRAAADAARVGDELPVAPRADKAEDVAFDLDDVGLPFLR